MRTIALTLTTLLLFVAATPADYVYHSASGYYVNNGLYYSRSYVQPYFYYQHGYQYYQPAYYAYQQVQYTPPAANVTVNLPAATDKNWRNRLLEIAAAREEEMAYESAIRLLGINRGGYGMPAYGQYGTLNLSAFSTTGSTGYAYNQSVNDLFKATDIDALLQRYSQLLDQQSQIAGTGVRDFGDLIDKRAEGQSRVLEFRAKAEVLALIAGSLNGPPTTASVNIRQQTGPAPLAPQPPEPVAAPNTSGLSPQQIDLLWQASAQKCVGCHSDKNPERAFLLSKLDGYDDVFRAKILARIRPSTPVEQRMPRAKDGSPGQPLPEAEYNVWRMRLALKVKG